MLPLLYLSQRPILEVCADLGRGERSERIRHKKFVKGEGIMIWTDEKKNRYIALCNVSVRARVRASVFGVLVCLQVRIRARVCAVWLCAYIHTCVRACA